jgi:hypothetical protein
LGGVVQRACQEAVLSRDGIGGAAFPNWLWLFRGTCANQKQDAGTGQTRRRIYLFARVTFT